VAELAGGFLCGEAGIAPAVLDAAAAYVRGWLRALSQPLTLDGWPSRVCAAASI